MDLEGENHEATGTKPLSASNLHTALIPEERAMQG